MKMRLAGRLVLAIVALALAGLAAACGGPPPEVKPEVGYTAPGFQLRDLNAKDVKLSDFRGKVVVLNFWATWCGPCRDELPVLQSLAQRYGGRLVVVGVDEGEAGATVAAFARTNGLSYPILLDVQMTTGHDYEVSTIPRTLVIDGNGVIRYNRRGTLIPADLDAALKTLLP